MVALSANRLALEERLPILAGTNPTIVEDCVPKCRFPTAFPDTDEDRIEL